MFFEGSEPALIMSVHDQPSLLMLKPLLCLIYRLF